MYLFKGGEGVAVTIGTTLLLAEDESIILVSLEEALTDGGYEVTTALNGAEALERLEQHADTLRGLITDVRLGRGIDGWEVARRAREISPGIAVIYVTGDSAADWPSQGVPNSVVLQKPFAHAQLVTAISNLLIQGDSALSAPTQ